MKCVNYFKLPGDASVSANRHLIPFNGFSRVHECDSRHIIRTHIQTERPRCGNICRSRRNHFQWCRLKTNTSTTTIWELSACGRSYPGVRLHAQQPRQRCANFHLLPRRRNDGRMSWKRWDDLPDYFCVWFLISYFSRFKQGRFYVGTWGTCPLPQCLPDSLVAPDSKPSWKNFQTI